jgi:hypothetical protein
MTRKMKTLALALFAVAAIGMTFANGASASLFRTNNPNETTLFSSQHEGVAIGVEYGEVKCPMTSYSGITGGEELATFELTPSYSECKATAGPSVTIKMNGCKYVFNAGEFDEKSNTEGWLDIVCPEGQKITAEVVLFGTKLCTVTIPPQNELKKVTYTNKADSEGVFTLLFEVGISGFTYSQDPGSGLGKCPEKNNAKNGTLTTQFTLRGSNPETKTPVNIWIE